MKNRSRPTHSKWQRGAFIRIGMVCVLLLGAAGLAWAGQTLLAQVPQEQQPPRRILPRRPFRNFQLNKNDPKNNSPKEGDKPGAKPDEKPEDNPSEEPNENSREMPDDQVGARQGNSLSIVERTDNTKKSSGNSDADADKEREALFVGWNQPKVVLFLTGNQMGYIEPCGCAGLENQKGGLTRRITLLQDLTTNKGWEVVPLDVGQLSNEDRADRQQEIKLQMIGKGLTDKMKYQAVGIGPSDLALSTAEVGGIFASLPAVSANVSIFERSAGIVPTHRVIKSAGMRIGVTQIVSDSALRKILAGDIEKEPVAKAMAAVVTTLNAEKCDFNVLLAYAQPEEAEALAKKFPGFDLVVHGELHGDPEREMKKLSTKPGARPTYVVGVGYKGMHASVVGLFNDNKAPVKYQRVPLDARFKDSEEGLQLLADYQRELKSAGLKGLGIQPKAFPGGREFVGSNECGTCHTKAFAKWQTTPHAHATDTIVNPKERSNIARHHDPECLSCHVTGWNPQKYYPYTTGYVDLEKSAHLHANGCENCHGPGSKHVAAESAGGVSDAELSKLRESMRLPLASAKKKCQECHDIDNSPEFDKEGAFERYWEEVKHPGRD
jgi:hypothetical protein